MLFATDLHGDERKYKRLAEAAAEHGADVIVIGGDISPKSGGDMFEIQRPFYAWLRQWADAQMVPTYTELGNDDLRCYASIFHQECDKSKNLRHLLFEGEILGFRYVCVNEVPETPFGLLDWSVNDSPGWVSSQLPFSRYSVVSEVVYPGGKQKPIYRFRDIKDRHAFLKGRRTISEMLADSKKPADIVFTHSPPAGLMLDFCMDGRGVGSAAVRAFIEKKKPIVSLHGHLHESPDVTGVWKAPLGDTQCIQPGDRYFVIIDIVDRDVAAQRIRY